MTTLVDILINGISRGAMYALVALGYTMVYGVLGMINFAHGEIFMIGMFSCVYAIGVFSITALAARDARRRRQGMGAGGGIPGDRGS